VPRSTVSCRVCKFSLHVCNEPLPLIAQAKCALDALIPTNVGYAVCDVEGVMSDRNMYSTKLVNMYIYNKYICILFCVCMSKKKYKYH
jgi:hypothetical protein